MQNLRGILLMTYAMLAFAGEDAFLKSLSLGMPVSQVLVLLGVSGAFVFAIITFLQRGTLAPLVHSDMGSPLMLLRNTSEGISAVFFVTALSLLPLSTVSAVFQATPLLITAGAAMFLGEQVGWRRWSAILLGFAGVLIIIRPGGEGFQLAALLPIAAVFGIALRDLLTRQMDSSIPSLSVAFYGFFAIIPAGLIIAPFLPPFVMPSATIFHERPDGWTYLGAAIVIATGIYTFLRERHSITARAP